MSSSVAPDFDNALGWLNTDKPLRLRDELRGQVVVLDFWTYCCANCMHILPDMTYLEEKYKTQPVAFLGVHSAKFTNEASSETIRAAILRYEIKHPVVIDDQMKIWRSYQVRSWPTVVVIDSDGNLYFSIAGEGNREAIDQAIDSALSQGRSAGTLADGPLQHQGEASVRSASGLKFPGKVLADAETNRLYIADSNHNRIIIAELPDESGQARVIKVVGSGCVGQQDGPANSATFNHPQGLAIGQGNLYVADTENHLIRAINLATYEVTTLVGTGELSNDCTGGAMGTQQGLNSPWDLCIEGATLYVAMAGRHQIWRIDLPVGFARAFAGNGRENLVDGSTEQSAFAQPSGICILDGQLYVADSEVSAIRTIDMVSEKVSTVIGEGLFSFGDVDGAHPQAKFQHPLGVAAWNDSLLVADTYNHKIKQVDPAGRSSRTLFGSGRVGASTQEGQVEFFEPGGLSVAGDHVYVADTNNHRLVRIHLESGKWHEIRLTGLNSPPSEDTQESAAHPTEGNVTQAEPVALSADKDIALVVNFDLPSGAHLSSEAPWSVGIIAGDKTIFQYTGKSDSLPLQTIIPKSAINTGSTWIVTIAFAYCTDGPTGPTGLCIPVQHTWRLDCKPGDATTINLSTSA